MQNEEAVMSESYHTFHLKKRGTAMKRSLQTLFLLLVLILSFSLVSCDEEAVSTEETITISTDEKLEIEYQKMIDFQGRKIREELSSKRGAEFEELVTKLLKGTTTSKPHLYMVYSNNNVVAEDRLAGPYYEPTTQEILFYFAVEAFHANDVDCAQYILTQLFEYREKHNTSYSLNFSGQIKSGLIVSYNLVTLQTLLDSKKEQSDAGKANQNFQTLVQNCFGDSHFSLQEYSSLDNYLNTLSTEDKQRIGSYTWNGITYTPSNLKSLYLTFAAQQKTESWKDVQAGDFVTMGVYEQDNNLENGKEPILWSVTARAGDKLYLRSLYVLEALPWNSTTDPSQSYAEKARWDNSTVRAWLNGEFYDAAFSEEEKKRIVVTALDNSWSIDEITADGTTLNSLKTSNVWHSVGGEDTQDRVYIDTLYDYLDLISWEHGGKTMSSGHFIDSIGETQYVADRYRRDMGVYERQLYKNLATVDGKEIRPLVVNGLGKTFGLNDLSSVCGVRPCIQIQIPAA